MTVRLTVARAEWEAHVHDTVAYYRSQLVPVVKGNGYGFGRPTLHGHVVASGQPEVCVGTIHELHDVPDVLTPIVLTPALRPPTGPDAHRAVLTVGSQHHVTALAGWQGRVVVKLASSMRRFGATPSELPAVLDAVAAAGLAVHSFALHLPLDGDDDARLAEVAAWLPLLSASTPLTVSHLTPTSFHDLTREHRDRPIFIRMGTALWHGVPRGSFLHLSADVLHVQHVRAGDVAGYHHSTVPADGVLVAIGGGTAHGIAPLEHADPAMRSPFHFQRRRLSLLERPHMHTSLVVVPNDAPCPAVGDRVDVQRPLITVTADEVVWE